MTGDDELFERQSIDDILDGNTVDELNPKPGEEVGTKAEDDKSKGEGDEPSLAELNGEGEQGKEPKDAPPASASEDDDLTGKAHIPVKQAIDERQKRKAAEDRAKVLEEENARLRQQPQGQTQQNQQTQQPQAQPQTRPDPYTDPDGAAAWDSAQADEREFNLRCELTRDTFMEIKGEDDYLEKETAFIEEINRNPALRVALRQAPNPAKYAYQEGAKLLVQKEIGGDPTSYRERLKAEILAEIKAEQQAGTAEAQPAADKPKARIPQSLAKETSAPSPSQDGGWDGPTPLSKLLPA